MVAIGTRKHFEVIIMYKLFLVIGKCTVAAAYNVSVNVLQRVVLHRKYMGIFSAPIEARFVPTPAAFEGLHFDM